MYDNVRISGNDPNVRKPRCTFGNYAGELTYPEEDHHAEHGQQGGDHHTEEHRQFLRLPLLSGLLPGGARVLLHGLSGRRCPRVGVIDAGGEAVVEERSPLGHGEPWRPTTS